MEQNTENNVLFKRIVYTKLRGHYSLSDYKNAVILRNGSGILALTLDVSWVYPNNKVDNEINTQNMVN